MLVLIRFFTPQWASYQIRKLWVVHAPGMPGTFSPPKKKSLVSDPACITARAWRTCCDACRDRLPALAGRPSRHSRRMRNPQFFVSDKKPMVYTLPAWDPSCQLSSVYIYGRILFIVGTYNFNHDMVCLLLRFLTLTFIFKVIWLWISQQINEWW